MVGAVSQAMVILDILADSGDGASVSELSDRLGINKGSASRLLSTLEHDGYVIKNPATGRYELTLRLLALVNRLTDRLGFPGSARPIIDRLAAQVGELVQLCAADSRSLYVIAEAEADKPIAVKSLLGRVLALHATAAGKAWLSVFPLDQATAILARQGLPALTRRTITGLGRLRAELERAAAVGYATQNEELADHLCAIAVPLRHRVTAAPLGALAIVAPTFRFSPGRHGELVDALRAAGDAILAAWPDGFVRILRVAESADRGVLLGA